MIDRLIHASLENRTLVVIAALILCVIGTQRAFELPVDVLPDLTAPTVTIICEGHGMAPTDMELQVTFPIESALNGAQGVRRVRSSTSTGISIVWADFGWGEDLTQARRVIGERLAPITANLPDGITPVIAPASSVMGEILFLGLRSDERSSLELRRYARSGLERRLLAIPGVSHVAVIGGDVEQQKVELGVDRLARYDVSLDEVTRALIDNHRTVSAGFVDSAGSEYLVSGRGRFRSIEEIGAVVVREVAGSPILIRDLGTVERGSAPKRGVGSVRGHPAVVISIQKQPGANTLDLTERIDRFLDDAERSMPSGIVLERDIFRQSDFIAVAVRNVLHALRDGSLLVVAILLVFLASPRATFITLTAIPLAFVAAILTLEMMGATINTMTLGGLAIATGALVDDAIIDVENVIRRLRMNTQLAAAERRSALSVIYDASREIRSSIAFATLIVILVFVPIWFLPGIEGRLLRPLATAYVVSLFASLIVALTVTPALCALLLPRSHSVHEKLEPRIARALKTGYGIILERVLRSPKMVAWGVSIGLLLAIALVFPLGRAFLPDFNEGALTVNASTLPGISLAHSDELGRKVEEVLLSHPEVRSTARRTGRAEVDEHAQEVSASEIDATIELGERSKEEFLEELRDDLSKVPGVIITIGQPISHRIDHMLSGTRASIAVKIFGPDLLELRRLGERVRGAMENEPGIVDLSAEQQTDVPLLAVDYDRAALARHGVSAETVGRALEAAHQGLRVARIVEGGLLIDLVVRLGSGGSWPIDEIGSLPIDLPSGGRVPLAALANIRKDKEPNTISRENIERKFVVQANVSGRDLVSVVEGVRKRVDPILASSTNYRVEYGGQFESAESTQHRLILLGIGIIVGIGFLLHAAFGSARDALLIMLNLPLALIGGVAGVWASGGVLSVASMIGFITVFGIATRNGIMLVSHFRHLQREEGVADFHEAILRGSVERLLPILMTALGTALALVPLALAGDEPGSEIQTPMAIVILGGLISATLLNMIVVPTLFLRFGKPWVREAEGAAS
jgi:CzcA family heavy metal efflux pump